MIASLSLFIAVHLGGKPEQEIAAQYKKWDVAIVKHDEKTLDGILASRFVAIGKDKSTKNKKQFLDSITVGWKGKGPKEKSFTTKIVSIWNKEDTYFAKVKETLVLEGKSGKVEFTSLDTWQQFGATWRVTRTQPAN